MTPNVVEPMRQFLQEHFYKNGSGTVPEPQGVVSNVSPEHLAMLLEAKPEVVSFHFGLPEQETVDAIKSAGPFVQSSATTVAEAWLLELVSMPFSAVFCAVSRRRRSSFSFALRSALYSSTARLVAALLGRSAATICPAPGRSSSAIKAPWGSGDRFDCAGTRPQAEAVKRHRSAFTSRAIGVVHPSRQDIMCGPAATIPSPFIRLALRRVT